MSVIKKVWDALGDAASVFFNRELESIRAKLYNIKYPQFIIPTLVPISSIDGPGAETITYRQFDSFGIMKWIASYADDQPTSDVEGREFSSIVKSIGGSYQWNIQEIKSL